MVFAKLGLGGRIINITKIYNINKKDRKCTVKEPKLN